MLVAGIWYPGRASERARARKHVNYEAAVYSSPEAEAGNPPISDERALDWALLDIDIDTCYRHCRFPRRARHSKIDQHSFDSCFYLGRDDVRT